MNSLNSAYSFSLFVVDDWPLDSPGKPFRNLLLEIVELRCGSAPIVFCTQCKQKDWRF